MFERNLKYANKTFIFNKKAILFQLCSERENISFLFAYFILNIKFNNQYKNKLHIRMKVSESE
jgi:hypothetical protein